MTNYRGVRRWGTGAGLAAGAGVVAALIGMAGAPAAHADGEVTSTDPIGLLNSGTADLTQANDVLSQADVPAQFQPFLSSIESFPDSSVRILEQAEMLQGPLFSPADPFSGFAAQLYGGLDQQFAQDSAAVLAASQAFVTDPSATTELGLLSATFQFDGVGIESIFPDVGAALLDHFFGLGGSDAAGLAADLAGTAGADLATSVVPDFPF